MSYVYFTRKQKNKKRKQFIRRLWLFVILLIVIVLAVVCYVYWHAMIPTIIDIAESRVRSQTLLAVNNSVATVLQNKSDCFADLLKVERDAQGQIVLLSANTFQVNELARLTAIATQTEIEKLAKNEIEIPFGTISGMPLLVERGPEITITVTPIGAVNCSFSSTFESVGVNQTLHRIYINVYCKIDLIIPTAHAVMETNAPILVSESLIVGKVPATYLNGGLLLGGYGNA